MMSTDTPPKGWEYLSEHDKGEKIKSKVMQKVKHKPGAQPGMLINMPGGAQGRLETIGSQIMTVRLIGHKKLKPEALGSVVTMGNTPLEIISTGKVIKLRMVDVEKEPESTPTTPPKGTP